MIRSRFLPAFLCLGCALSVATAQAAPSPPPPPPTPTCGWCKGPPPPPTAVPVVQPTVVAPVTPAAVVRVTLRPDQVKRGSRTSIEVMAVSDASVTVQVEYHKHKPTVFRGRAGNDGLYSRSWRVPKWAPTGKTSIVVRVGSNDPVTLILRINK